MDDNIKETSALETLSITDPESRGQAQFGRSLPEQRRKKNAAGARFSFPSAHEATHVTWERRLSSPLQTTRNEG